MTNMEQIRFIFCSILNIWEHMGTYGNIWEHMGTYGNIWEHMGTCIFVFYIHRALCIAK